MNFSCMSADEIRQSYKTAKNKKEQINVLCELTLSSRKEMLDFLGLPNDIKPCVDSAELEAEYRRLYEAGLSDRQIAELTNRTKGMVKHWRDKNGLPTKQTIGRSKKIPEERMLEVYKMGLNDRESCVILGVSVDVFRYFREKHDLVANAKRG